MLAQHDTQPPGAHRVDHLISEHHRQTTAALGVADRGISAAEVQAVKGAGYTDAQIVEIILHVALNTLTNYVNEVAKWRRPRSTSRSSPRSRATSERDAHAHPQRRRVHPRGEVRSRAQGLTKDVRTDGAGRGLGDGDHERARGVRLRALRVLDEHTLAFADFSGNRQYISLGNLADNPKVHLFLIDYANKRRIKIWGEATVVEDDPELLELLAQPAARGAPPYKARPEQAILIRVTAWDVNCPQHIPQRFEAADVAQALAARDAKIAAPEAELAKLRGVEGVRGE